MITKRDAEKGLLFVGVVCIVISIKFDNIAPMILYITEWVDYFYNSSVKENKYWDPSEQKNREV